MSHHKPAMLQLLPPMTHTRSVSVLLVEDDRQLAAMVKRYLAQYGFAVHPVADGSEGLALALSGRHELVILDMMLPHLAGLDVLRYIRRRSAVPVIVVTARGASEDRVAGLRAGADDYLAKPFEPDELLARIEAVLRRSRHHTAVAGDAIGVGGVSLKVGSREVRVRGKKVDFTSVEFDILELLMRSAGRAVSRDEMTSILHQRETTPYERSLDVHVSHLRRKIDEDGRESLILAVRGVGYLFRAD